MEAPTIPFAALAVALLIMPGPTNTLIATCSAIAGFKRALLLLPCELGGYILAISTYALGLAAIVNATPAALIVIKALAAAVLLVVACRLWLTDGHAENAGDPVGPRGIFFTTLCNPKALVMGLAIVPELAHGHSQRIIPYLVGLCALTPTIGTGWVAMGALLGRGLLRVTSPKRVARLGAAVILGFAMAIIATAALPYCCRCNLRAAGANCPYASSATAH